MKTTAERCWRMVVGQGRGRWSKWRTGGTARRDLWAGFLAVGLGGSPVFGGEGGDGWWFEAGPAVRVGMSASARGPSYVQKLGLHDPSATGRLSPPGGIGSATAYGDR